MNKKNIKEQTAVAKVLDSSIKEITHNWGQIWDKISEIAGDRLPRELTSDFARFQFIIASSAVNLRVAFDLFGRKTGERIFNIHMEVMKKFLGDDERFTVVRNSTLAYMDAYNRGIINIGNPLDLVAIELVLNYGIMAGGDQPGPTGGMNFDPAAADYLSKAMGIFSGKWDKIEAKFNLVP